MQKYLRRKDAAAYLGVAPQTLARWAVEGFGPSTIHMGRAVTYAVEDLDQFAASRRRPTPETRTPSGRAA